MLWILFLRSSQPGKTKGERDKNIGYNWVAGNGLNLDLDSDYTGVDIYKQSTSCTHIAVSIFYIN